ncbi:hypothetical protein C1645_800922 [Glomus cerebriforme]|uniref:HCP-like protein n=1 Tax=Glomus cerebriforme TaxID=658196 RepID=A0A397TLQ4_9GLOM|nr:hypothetical protein C1645_800922 [Glomus cerebriforme]
MNMNIFKGKKSKKQNNEPNIPSSTDDESIETLSLENESFISFKTKPNSTVELSIKSLSYSISRMTLKRKQEKVVKLVKEKLRTIPPKFNNDFKNFISKESQKYLEDNFLGYYECLIPGNTELSIPKIFLSTARIDLHEEKTENPEKAKRLVLTKIKESPFVENVSLFIITGKRKPNSSNTGWTGIKFNKFPDWMKDDSIKHLINGPPVKGLGTYKILIKKIENTNIYKDLKLKELEENAKSEIGYNYKMTLAGFYMLGIKENYLISTDLSPEAENWYKKAIKLYQKAEKLGSIEAKLCLGYMYSIGFSIAHYDPQKAKKFFKEVIDANNKTEVTIADKKGTEEKMITEKNITKEMIIDKKMTEEKVITEKNITEEMTTDKIVIGEMITGKSITKETTTDKNAIEETTADKEVTEDIITDKIMEETAVNKVTENASKELSRIAMRNIALIYHNSYVIKPFEWKNFIKISKPNDISIKKLSKIKLNLAIKWYKKSCELGDSQSAYNLGLLYENNDEIKDKNEAEEWFKKAVQFDNKNLYAKAKLGRILINKDNVNENEKMDGIQMLKYTAENGLVMGQTFLGEAYERGQVEKKANYKEASKLYFKAASQNHGYYSHIAQYRLRELRALEYIPAGENIENILKLYVKELKYYYNNNEEMLKNIH